MQFKEWLILSESIEINFDQFIEDLKTHARPDEDELKRQKIDDNKKKFIIDALKKKNQENKQYLKYLLGFSTTPASQHSEDYDRAIDTLIWFIQTNKLPKRQIEADGWFNTGKKANELMSQKNAILNVVSKSQEKRDKKAGISADLPLVAQSGNIKIFLSKKVMSKDELKKLSKEDLIKHPDIVARHKFLCRYGKETNWCTASPDGDYHAQYGGRDIYIVQIDDKPAYQFMECTKYDTDKQCQFHDEKNKKAKYIPIELAELIIKNLPDIGKFYPVVYSNFIKNQNDILNIFEIDSMEKLTDENVFSLLSYESNKEEMAKILGAKNISKLTDENVSDLLLHATNKDEMVNIIFQYKKELTDSNVHILLAIGSNKEKIAKFILKNKKELTGSNVLYLLYFATNKKEMAELLGAENINKLTNVSDLLHHAKNKDEMAEILGAENISKLTDENVFSLLSSASNKEEMAKILGAENISKLTDDNVYYLLHHAENKKEIAKILGSENISKLTDKNVFSLLRSAKNKDEMANIIFQYKKELTDEHVASLLHHAENKKEMAKILGSENISRLTDKNVSDLLYYATNKEEIKRILQQYGRNLKNISLSPTEKNHSSGSNLYSFASYAKKIMPTLLSWL